MDTSEFRKRGREMVDYIADYLENIHLRRILPEVQPGYLRGMLPDKPPRKGEDWKAIMKDVENAIMPGVTHWQHPRFHAYFPAGNSYPSILGDMLSDAMGGVGFSWAASPACTELEIIVVDWLAKMIGLPPVFWHEHGIGGGVIQGSASDCVFVSLLAARHAVIKDLKKKYPTIEEGVLLSKLVAYCSKMAHSCVEKAGMIALVKMRELETDQNYSLRGNTLQKAIEEDRKTGLIPFYVCATLGTTAVCSFDNLYELGLVCERETIWLHVDAAYAGSALICPEFQHFMRGKEHVNSFNMNPNKWMLVNFDCSTMWGRDWKVLCLQYHFLRKKAPSASALFFLTTSALHHGASGGLGKSSADYGNFQIWQNPDSHWVRDRKVLTTALTVDPLYLQHNNSDKAVDFRHWGIPLSRRFRSLKLWFVIRSYGVEGLQKYIREHCRLAKKFEALVRTDSRFEILGRVTMGLVCFRLKGHNSQTQTLLRALNLSGKIHMVPALINDDYVIRFAVCAQNANEDDISHAWNVISAMATDVMAVYDSNKDNREVKTIEKIESAETESEEESADEEPKEVEKFEQEATTEDEVFLFDNNIPSLPSIPNLYEEDKNGPKPYRRRNMLIRMVSDPKCYQPKLLKTLSQNKRHRSDPPIVPIPQEQNLQNGTEN